MSFTLFEVTLIIGIVHGVVASAFMLSTRRHQPHQRLLGFIILVFSIVISRGLLNSLGWTSYHWVRFLPLGPELFLPPLVYLYVCLVTSASSSDNPSYFKHLLLPLVWCSYDLTVYFSSVIQPDPVSQAQITQKLFYTQINTIEDKLILISTWFYLLLGVSRFRQFIHDCKKLDHHKSKVLHRWILHILAWMVVLAVFLLINNLMDLFKPHDATRLVRWQGFNVYLALTTYYLATLGVRLQSPRLFDAIQSIKVHQHKSQTNTYPELEQKLHQYLFEEEHYADPEISSKQVAEALGIPPESLSFHINRKLKTSFRDLVNQYRITAFRENVKRLASQNELANTSILNLAMDSGFNSQASFYRVFKKIEGTTPRQFVDKDLENS